MWLLLRKFFDLLLYGNFWIAACAAAMTLQTQYLLSGRIHYTPLVGFVFFATLLLYALHRIVGIPKVDQYVKDLERYRIISTFRGHIILYAALGMIGAACYFVRLTRPTQLAILLPALISLAYVLPVIGKAKRLRDIHYIKIFLIAIVWSFISVVLPTLEYDLFPRQPGGWWFMWIERALFIFAITLPFDIRDLRVDHSGGVKTIPGKVGIRKTRWIGLLALCLAAIAAAVNFYTGTYGPGAFLGILLSFAVSYLLIHITFRFKHDYYFSGLVDGTMLLQLGLVLLLGHYLP